MVAYGAALRTSRRPGWEQAYVDYDALRTLLERMGQEDDIWQAQNEFQTKLRLEADKVSLFTLTRQGEIAESLGALKHKDLIMTRSVGKTRRTQSTIDDEQVVTDNLGEQAALLPYQSIVVGTPRPSRAVGKSISSQQMFRPDRDLLQSTNDIESLAILGVELLHLLRFIYANAMAFRKIYKKYNKVMMQLKVPDSVHNNSNKLKRTKGYLTFTDGPEEHIQNLANSVSVATIHFSLQSTLTELEKQEKENKAADVENDRDRNAILLRFKCTVMSIAVLREYAQRMDETFKSFLSQKSMIATGHNNGGLSEATQQALHVVMRFQPDSLLLMDNAALVKWNDRIFGDDTQSVLEGQDVEESSNRAWGGASSSTMILNLTSTLLYTVSIYPFCFYTVFISTRTSHRLILMS